MEPPPDDAGVLARLRRDYDAGRLRADLARVAELRGRPAGYAGEAHRGWTSLCLASSGDAAGPAAADGLLDRTPYLHELVRGLGGAVVLARLLALEPGGIIAEHRDAFLARGLVRLHVPIVTHEDAELVLAGRRCRWRAGELWYGDFSRPHRARNRSPLTRVHLVLDAVVDEELLALFPPGPASARLRTDLQRAAGRPTESADLERLAFDFDLPAGFAPPASGYAPLAEPAACAARVFAGRLLLLVEGQPLLELEPCGVSGDEVLLDLVGLPGAQLALTRQGPHVASAELRTPAGPVAIRCRAPRQRAPRGF